MQTKLTLLGEAASALDTVTLEVIRASLPAIAKTEKMSVDCSARSLQA